MKRSKSYRLHQKYRHIKRKESIVKNVYLEDFNKVHHGNRLNKGKVHCSCQLCKIKTNRRKSIYGGWKHSDIINMSKGKED